MKNLKEVSDRSNFIKLHGPLPLYYSVKEDAVFTEDGEDRFYLTDLIRFNDPEMIRETVRKFLSY